MGVSRRRVLAMGSGLLSAVAAVGAAPGAAAASRSADAVPADGITPAPIIAVEPGEPTDLTVAKAANVVPRPPQLAWQQHEVTCFTHYGMNTFTDREWGSGCEDEAWYDPQEVDVEQWMRTYRTAGAGLAMLVAKHHDGFVLYPTRYTNHSVIASPWWLSPDAGATRLAEAERARARARAARDSDPSAYWQVRTAGDAANPHGDVLRDYVTAARAAGLRVGVYLSPADGSELPHAWHVQYVQQIKAKAAAGQPLSTEEQSTLDDADRTPSGSGRYGSGGAVTTRTIPTLVANDDRAAAVAQGRMPSFTVEVDDYNAYYLNQVYELLTEYGPIDELWLDGANPWSGSGITETYDFPTIYRLIRQLSPDTLVFGGPEGIRWVGNENGVARESEWSVVPTTADPATAPSDPALPGTYGDGSDVGSRARISDPSVRFLEWYPAECDVSIRPGWFHHDNEQPKTAEALVALYEQSVGRNAVLLVNVPPAANGRIDDSDIAALAAFRASIRATYGDDTLAHAPVTTRWSPPDNATTGSLVVELPGTTTFDRIRLGEDVHRGQRVEQFAVDVWDETAWREVASATVIGLSRILPLTAPVSADRIRLRILQARATPGIASAAVHLGVPPA